MNLHPDIAAVINGKSEGCIICGNCLDIMTTMPSKCINAVIVDLPYGITSCKWDNVIPIGIMWKKISHVITTNAVAIFTASQPFTSMIVMSNLDQFRHEWIWIKNRGSNFANTVREPMKEHESILVFSPGNWTYNKQMQERTGSGTNRTKYNCAFVTKSDNYRKFANRPENTLSKLRVPSSWQKFNTVCGKEKVGHSTQKPEKLMAYLIKTYTNPGDIVLDFAVGSGTTCVAAKYLGRRWIGIDIVLEYCEIARNRLRDTEFPLFPS